LQVSYISEKNTKCEDKPNEDFVLCDADNGIFILLDGVSRDLVNGKYPYPSPAKEATVLLGKQIYNNLCVSANTNHLNEERIIAAVTSANKEVLLYNQGRELSFAAGAVGIVAVICKKTFYYVYIGDCCGRLIRNNSIKQFTEFQTALISEHKREFSASQIRNEICNNSYHPYGYGVLNGDPNAIHFLRSGSFGLSTYDQIILSSDGMEEYLLGEHIDKLMKKNAEALINSAKKMQANNQDDRTVIKIIIT